jgi:hypothetical protein
LPWLLTVLSAAAFSGMISELAKNDNGSPFSPTSPSLSAFSPSDLTVCRLVRDLLGRRSPGLLVAWQG